jgi:hypothetical protein
VPAAESINMGLRPNLSDKTPIMVELNNCIPVNKPIPKPSIKEGYGKCFTNSGTIGLRAVPMTTSKKRMIKIKRIRLSILRKY